MKCGDILWVIIILGISALFVVPGTHSIFIELTKYHPYIMGFVKFAILATMGELLAVRIIEGTWKNPQGGIYRSVIWGLIGMLIALMFQVFSSGIVGAVSAGMLWAGDEASQKVWVAFWIGAIMNLTFGPAFMTAHRITDTYIDLTCGEGIPLGDIKLSDVIAKIDWQGLVSFVFLKTIPLFWIPAHTITFLLPPEYRVLVAAYLSIALGAILAYGKRGKLKSPNLEVQTNIGLQ